MRRNQKGEVMLVMMAVMLVVIWLGTGHTGMMGHGADGGVTKAENQPPASKDSAEPQH
jgi:hypothetical protein